MEASGKIYKSVMCKCALSFLEYDTRVEAVSKNFKNYDFIKFINFLFRDKNTTALANPNTVTIGEIYNNTPRIEHFEIDYENLNDTVRRAIKPYGGEFRVRAGDKWNDLFFDYTTEIIIGKGNSVDTKGNIGESKPVEIRLSHNLQQIEKFVDTSQIFNRLYAFGAKIISDERETETRYTLPSKTGGFVMPLPNVSFNNYGIVSRVQIFDDINDEEILEEIAQKVVDENSLSLPSYRITALDLSLIGIDVNEFTLGGWCQLR